MKKRDLFKETPFFFSVPAIIWQVLFFVIPLCSVLTISFVKDWEVSFFSGFTLSHYVALFDAAYFYIISRSVVLAFGTTITCLLLGYPIAYYVAFRAQKLKNVFLFFLILPFWTNFLVQVYSWFFLLEKEGLLNNFLLSLGIISEPFEILNTYVAVAIVMIYCYLPFMIMPVYSILEKIDPSLFEASADLGATPNQTLLNVIFPLSVPGILTGFFLVFVPSFSEFVIPLLLGGDKYMFVGGLITHYFLTSRSLSLGAAFTTFSSLVLLFFCVILSKYISRNYKTKGL